MVCGCLDWSCVRRCSCQCDVHVVGVKHRSEGNAQQSVVLVAAGWQRPLSTGNQAEAFSNKAHWPGVFWLTRFS